MIRLFMFFLCTSIFTAGATSAQCVSTLSNYFPPTATLTQINFDPSSDFLSSDFMKGADDWNLSTPTLPVLLS